MVRKCIGVSLGGSDVCGTLLMCGYNFWDTVKCHKVTPPDQPSEFEMHALLPHLLKGKGWLEKCVGVSLGGIDVCGTLLMCWL